MAGEGRGCHATCRHGHAVAARRRGDVPGCEARDPTQACSRAGPLVVRGEDVVFRSLRARVQRLTDRRFNRTRYDAARVVEGFSGRVRDHVERGPLVDDLCGAVRSTVQPQSVGLWIPQPVDR